MELELKGRLASNCKYEGIPSGMLTRMIRKNEQVAGMDRHSRYGQTLNTDHDRIEGTEYGKYTSTCRCSPFWPATEIFHYDRS